MWMLMRWSFFQVLTSTKEIEMWGDGKQTRSFTYIDDCVEGILRVTKSDFKEPLNVGSSEMVGSKLSNFHVNHDYYCMCL
jgi:nucleoside-diphosphate-sugar epimerase